MQAKTAPRFLTMLLIFLALAAAALCTVSVHAKNGHIGQWASSMDVFERISTAANTPNVCEYLIVAACPFASITDKTSPRFGELSPQARVYCGDAKLGMMAVFGLKNPDNPVFVTGYMITRERFYGYCKRDGCVQMDMTYLRWLLR